VRIDCGFLRLLPNTVISPDARVQKQGPHKFSSQQDDCEQIN
jgi:hypothetical protein